MILVLPQTQRSENGIVFINHAVAIATIFSLIKFSQCQKPIAMIGRWLRRNVAEKLRTVINLTVAIAVECKPSII